MDENSQILLKDRHALYKTHYLLYSSTAIGSKLPYPYLKDQLKISYKL